MRKSFCLCLCGGGYEDPQKGKGRERMRRRVWRERGVSRWQEARPEEGQMGETSLEQTLDEFIGHRRLIFSLFLSLCWAENPTFNPKPLVCQCCFEEIKDKGLSSTWKLMQGGKERGFARSRRTERAVYRENCHLPPALCPAKVLRGGGAGTLKISRKRQ